jgi:DNA polymerase-3 subunit epsilon
MIEKKILFFDSETSGLNPYLNDVVQLAYILEINNKIVTKGDLKFRPINENTIEEDALAIAGFTKAQVMEFPDSLEQYEKFTSDIGQYIDKYDRTDKASPAGYNVYFDYKFLMELQNKLNIKYGLGCYLNHRIQDPMLLLSILVVNGFFPDLENLKLETICKYLKIPHKAHDAMSDISATRELYYLLLKKTTFDGVNILE